VSTQTINHGLGVAPELIIAKERESGSGTGDWAVWHKDLSSGKYMVLNVGQDEASWTDALFSNIGTTSVDVGNDPDGYSIYLNDGMGPNTYVAYFFASKAGYSKVGSYTPNGVVDGPFVYCGFKPAFLITKWTGQYYGGQGWGMKDSTRDTYNPADALLSANASSAEGTNEPIDLLSNGFKIRANNNTINSPNGSEKYIFYAVAESPFKYANAR